MTVAPSVMKIRPCSPTRLSINPGADEATPTAGEADHPWPASERTGAVALRSPQLPRRPGRKTLDIEDAGSGPHEAFVIGLRA
ncbi:hypothetical protein BX257_4120 [Streptomyces sp. 3212.3]|nr:hypothetical protein BX257_4120 [Streptomyces sp. 3212.3]